MTLNTTFLRQIFPLPHHLLLLLRRPHFFLLRFSLLFFTCVYDVIKGARERERESSNGNDEDNLIKVVIVPFKI